MPVSSITPSEFILGGQKSGKSRRAESLARAWLDASPQHNAVFIATAQAWDDEMRQRIERHQHDRAQRLAGMVTVEEPLHIAEVIARHNHPDTLVVVDCLTLWLVNILMPHSEEKSPVAPVMPVDSAYIAPLLIAIQQFQGAIVLVGNEIGLGVIPMGREVREYVDALGLLNQQVAAACERVTLMAAGLPLILK